VHGLGVIRAALSPCSACHAAREKLELCTSLPWPLSVGHRAYDANVSNPCLERSSVECSVAAQSVHASQWRQVPSEERSAVLAHCGPHGTRSIACVVKQPARNGQRAMLEARARQLDR
jgi:hypothetical protein